MKKILTKIQKKWVEALRSGEYTQGQGCLKDPDLIGDGNPKYCCLGVLCDLYGKDKGQDWAESYMLDQDELLPPEVMKWAGIVHSDGLIHNIYDGYGALTGMNDDGQPFEYIADFIENHPEEIFNS